MTTILQLNSSLFGDNSQSTRLANEFTARLAQRPTTAPATVIVRDLAREPLPHLDAERFTAFGTPAEKRTPEQQRIVAESDALIAELKAADAIVIGLPMYNFGVPSTLKAYFDHVARAGVTFRYAESGPVGLLTGKKAYVVATRGGQHAGSPRDLQSAFVRQFLSFVGITEVEFVYAEGLALGDASRAAALSAAAARIEQVAA
ncbi:MAG TPA: NAD(P)H-dependent oxidoreductase [Steroidobacteraceae bacterium]|nr:NAD(P)H-dependent oxidoreductase [Steroidobacteraceae bacterium]